MDVRKKLTVIVNVTTTELRYTLPFDVTSGQYEVRVSAFSNQHSGEPANRSTEPPHSGNILSWPDGFLCTQNVD